MPEGGREPGQFGRVEIPVEFTKKNLKRSGEIAKQEASRIWKEAGGDASKAFIKIIEERFKRDLGDAKEALARGLIDEKEFKRQADRAGQAFDDAILKRIKELATSGEGAQHEMTDLANRLKLVGREAKDATDKGIGGFNKWKAAIGAVVAFVAGSRVVDWLRNAARAGVELGRSYLQLQASAKLFGVAQSDLNDLSREGVERYALSVTVANQLAASTAKLANRAEQGSKSQELLNRALDLGAANGLAADEVAQSLEQTLRGLDEGTDKLLQRNPQDIYRQYAASLGRTAESLTDVERKQALVNAILTEGTKVSGEYARFLESDIGRLTRWEQLLQRAREEIGTSLIPILADLADVLSGPLQAGVDIFTGFLDAIDGMTNSNLETLVETLREAGAEARALAIPELLLRQDELRKERKELRESTDILQQPRGARAAGFTGIGQETFRVGRRDVTFVELDALRRERRQANEELRDATDTMVAEGLSEYLLHLDEIIDRREREIEAAEELKQVETDLRTLRSGGTLPDREDEGDTDSGATPHTAEQVRKRAQAAKRLETLERDLASRLRKLTATATDDLLAELDRMEEEIRTAAREAGEALPEGMEEAFEKLRRDVRATGRLEGLQEQLRDLGRVEVDRASQAELRTLIQDIELERDALEEGTAAREAYTKLLHQAEDQHDKNSKALQRQREQQEKLNEEEKKKAEREAEQARKEAIRDIGEQARLLEQSARGAIQLASALDLVDEKAGRALENIVQIASAVKQISDLKGLGEGVFSAAGISALVSGVGALASLISVGAGILGGEDEAEARRKEIDAMLSLERALRDLEHAVLGEISGEEREDLLKTLERMFVNQRVRVSQLTDDELQALEKLRELTGIDLPVEDGIINLQDFGRALDELRKLDLGAFSKDLEGSLEGFRFLLSQAPDLFDTAADKFRAFLDVIAEAEEGKAGGFAQALRKKLDEDGADAVNEFIDSLSQRLASQDQSLFAEGGIFHGLTGQEARRLLEEGNTLIEELLQGGGGSGSAVEGLARARSITEVTASRMVGLDITRNMLLTDMRDFLAALAGGRASIPAESLASGVPASLIGAGAGPSIRTSIHVGTLVGEMKVDAPGGMLDENQVRAVLRAETEGLVQRVSQGIAEATAGRRAAGGR